MKEYLDIGVMTVEEMWDEIARSRAELERLRRKSRAHRKSLKEQQRALLERNSRIAHLDVALQTLFPVAESARASVTGYVDRDKYERPHEDATADLTTPVSYKIV